MEDNNKELDGIIEKAVMKHAIEAVFGIEISEEQFKEIKRLPDFPLHVSFNDFIKDFKHGESHEGSKEAGKDKKKLDNVNKMILDAQKVLEEKQEKVDTLYKKEREVKESLEQLLAFAKTKTDTINVDLNVYRTKEFKKVEKAIDASWYKAQEDIKAYTEKSQSMLDLTVKNTLKQMNATMIKVNAKELSLKVREEEFAKAQEAVTMKTCNCGKNKVKQGEIGIEPYLPDTLENCLKEIENQLSK
jgi:hypothetical protein